jgi:hypothetical protein
MEDVVLSPHERALYEKLHASHRDIGTARSCAEFILKKGWHSYSFMRRGSVPIQQTAFTTTMIVSYARPFSSGRGRSITFPHRLLQYSAKEKLFHERMLKLRNQQYAHTDPSTISVRPLKDKYITSIESISDLRFSPSELKGFIEMSTGVTSRISERLEVIRLSGS